jgi:hypothetical protein
VTIKALAKLVKRARDLQSHYFKTRRQSDLVASRTAGRELDQAVAEILNPPTLFDLYNSEAHGFEGGQDGHV